jgi:hypothetical protein
MMRSVTFRILSRMPLVELLESLEKLEEEEPLLESRSVEPMSLLPMLEPDELLLLLLPRLDEPEPMLLGLLLLLVSRSVEEPDLFVFGLAILKFSLGGR